MEDQKNINETKPEETQSGLAIAGITIPWLVIVALVLLIVGYYFYTRNTSTVKITMPEFNASATGTDVLPGVANIINQ